MKVDAWKNQKAINVYANKEEIVFINDFCAHKSRNTQ